MTRSPQLAASFFSNCGLVPRYVAYWPILSRKSSGTLLHIRRTTTDGILVLISFLRGLAFLRTPPQEFHFRRMLRVCVSEAQLGLLQHNRHRAGIFGVAASATAKGGYNCRGTTPDP